MAILVPNISTGLNEPKQAAITLALKKLGLTQKDITRAYIAKSSVDARKREQIQLVYSIGIEAPNEAAILKRAGSIGAVIRIKTALSLKTGEQTLAYPPVVAGFGPAGMFAALLLARAGFHPIVLERGGSVDERVNAVNAFWQGGALDVNTNVQFGEGGAGTFSDGKLTTRINDERCDFVLDEFCRHGAPADILEKAKPHIGTDKLRGVVKSIREEIIRLGGQVLFHTCLTDITVKDGRLVSVTANHQAIPCETLLLCIGHSARDTFSMLLQKQVAMQPKAFSVGVRIEQLQQTIDEGLYGRFAGHPALPKGEYQLSHRLNGRGVYTFCMCPGGFVVPSSSEENGVVTNGMSEYLRDGINANAAVAVGVEPADFGGGILDGIAFQRQLESAAFLHGGKSYKAPAQTAGRFLNSQPGLALGRIQPSYAIGVTEADFTKIFPPFVSDMLKLGLVNFNAKLKGFASPDAVLTGVETRTSSPVRILRDNTLQSQGVQGLYPCGEGAGYAGGIVSAAVDGVRIAQAVMERFRPFE
ncbi:NAD(P)/FAD-dependent oxidoreductase [Acetanaerobacterium elongatum]|uniref:FAD-dependent protein C-terminal domain-containing protein n=1 Tax=Acetanaerobacterium elongatum TaxID=258515 RepID=A0A1H0A6M5_9FIRM|nr:hypothetical protein [Acetanaerobacterium elongatum]SDN29077.1 hypothetical protein SAMN05192585_11544 [Acetanaerobacterium elongatum]